MLKAARAWERAVLKPPFSMEPLGSELKNRPQLQECRKYGNSLPPLNHIVIAGNTVLFSLFREVATISKGVPYISDRNETVEFDIVAVYASVVINVKFIIFLRTSNHCIKQNQG